MTALQVFCLILLVSIGISTPSAVKSNKNAETAGSVPEVSLILVSTLDGRLRALDIATGKEKWEMQEDPVIRAPSTVTQGFTFLPNPQDGSLYSLKEGLLRKLPFSIPQVVGASPVRGNDGVLYAGSKKDVWIGIDPVTGEKLETLSSASYHRVCPANGVHTVFIGRREYRVTMYDSQNLSRSWNTTFVDYSTHLQPEDSSYPLRHLVSSSSGDVLAIHEKTGSLLWQTDVGQPVVAMYMLRSNGLHKLAYTPVGRETMEGIVEKSLADSSIWADVISAAMSPSSKTGLYPALYVGESVHGLFASHAFVDEKTRTFAPRYLGPNLIEGPTPIALPARSESTIPPRREAVDIDSNTIIHKTEEGEFLVLGYHVPPQVNLAAVIPTESRHPSPFGPSYPPFIEYVVTREDKPQVIEQPVVTIDDASITALMLQIYYKHPSVVITTLFTVFVLIVASVWMCGKQMGAEAARSAQTSRVSMRDEGEREGEEQSSGSKKRPKGRMQLTGWIQVGKVHYDASDVLGTGCQGTVVYRGKFDDREVAVKRVLTEFLPLVDREVELLRESDSHPHVIRYFCMESDSQFRYLALELCVASLYDYIEKKTTMRDLLDISSEDILRQSTDGLAHLHSINIVHRDLKPQNVLISTRGRGRTRALISDFGLCKRLHPGRHSLSHRSGVAGTDGWIAPEALKGQSTSFPMDVFSLGCIFYYVLTEGSHPYGESLHRTSNILNGFHSLGALSAEDAGLSSHLISLMLLLSPSRRPSASAILIHPFFWGREKQLAFFGDVSDRVEKEVDMSPVLRRLEKNGFSIVKKNWRDRICDDLREDLRKFRTYKAHSVRDLLRAMRNKKHHYRELPENVRSSLGEVPHEFVYYFTSRFPELLMHVYEAMEWCSEEAIFVPYYSDEVRNRMKDIREETEKRMADENSDSDTWTRGRSSVSSLEGTPTSPPVIERKRLELLPRSTKPPTISESSDASSAPSEVTTPTMEELPSKDEEEEEQPATLVPRSELIVSKTTVTENTTVVLLNGPPPGLEDVIPSPPNTDSASQPVGRKKKNRKK
ncbi:hypothetical protein PFISCL1PPCAC_5870 [Pristionchus fissidentatus]|uniref:non-specific serine/threonine protein kinase n=1 Tax=Pristionchus fissidentatus TaxID=1538716 RepID=A0AAV5V8I7_9BILA|nr:hypothetical protein PFISCL1PPCAC_5870 [Pristionchus fissidentatus]